MTKQIPWKAFRRKGNGLPGLQQGTREALPAEFELTPTHGQVHIPMSTKAAEMCLHDTPTVSRAAFNDHHMLAFCFLPEPAQSKLHSNI